MRLAGADRPSDALLLSLWVRLHPEEKGEHHNGAAAADTTTSTSLPPSISFELLDVNASYAWLGFWRPCNLTHGAWAKCSGEVMLSKTLAGHDVQVSLLFAAHTKASYLVDDVSIVPRHLASSQMLSMRLLFIENFESEKRPAKPANGMAGRHIVLKLPKEPLTAANAAKEATADLHSSIANGKGKDSAYGALVKVPVLPTDKKGNQVAHIALHLGKFHGVSGPLTLTLSAKAAGLGTGPAGKLMGGAGEVGLEVLDETAGFKWIGSAERSHVTSAWHTLTLKCEVPPDAESHMLQVDLIFEGAAQYLIDDLKLEVPTKLYETIANLDFEGSDAISSSRLLHERQRQRRPPRL